MAGKVGVITGARCSASRGFASGFHTAPASASEAAPAPSSSAQSMTGRGHSHCAKSEKKRSSSRAGAACGYRWQTKAAMTARLTPEGKPSTLE